MNYSKYRRAIEKMYIGKCTISKYQGVKDPITKITKKQEVTVLIDQPCKLSFKTISPTNQNGAVSNVTQITKLFISPEVNIKPGSKITVTQDGITTDYEHSGEPAIYPTHQEIILNLFKGWA